MLDENVTWQEEIGVNMSDDTIKDWDDNIPTGTIPFWYIASSTLYQAFVHLGYWRYLINNLAKYKYLSWLYLGGTLSLPVYMLTCIKKCINLMHCAKPLENKRLYAMTSVVELSIN